MNETKINSMLQELQNQVLTLSTRCAGLAAEKAELSENLAAAKKMTEDLQAKLSELDKISLVDTGKNESKKS
jgi:hypothetical protein